MKYKIGLGIILILAVMQLFVAEKTPYQAPDGNDFFAIEGGSEEVQVLVKSICYDCHSNQISYPWYSEIAAVSWWLQDHIDEGREHLNFSEWETFPRKKKAHKMEESWEEVEEEEMPLSSYTFIHRDADLSDEERQILITFFKQMEQSYR